MDVCSREGDLLPMCCGTISSMRDIIMGTLRDAGWIEVDDLADLIGLMKQHEGFQELFEVTHRATVDPADPFLRIALAWEALDDCMERDYPHSSPKVEDPTDLRDAISILSQGCSLLGWRDLFRREEYDAESYPTMPAEELERRNADAAFKHAVDTTTVLLRLVPAIQTVYHQIRERYPDPVEGWTAVLREVPQWVDVPDDRPGAKEGATRRVLEPNISTDGFGHGIIVVAGGLAIYRTEAGLEDAIQIWQRSYPNIRDMIEVRKVRVDPERGIHFIG